MNPVPCAPGCAGPTGPRPLARGASHQTKPARAALHQWEEPCISGTSPAGGTVFFSGCTLKCVFCQNYPLSHENFGKEISTARLAEIFLELQEKGAHNINLVNGHPVSPIHPPGPGGWRGQSFTSPWSITAAAMSGLKPSGSFPIASTSGFRILNIMTAACLKNTRQPKTISPWPPKP